MQIGAIGAAAYNPYIYNTNTVSSASMNKISGIGSDLTSSKTDFGALTSQENINPLRRGESLDFAGIIDMQMQMSRMNADRLMKPPVETATQAAGIAENMQDDAAMEAVKNVAGSAAMQSMFDVMA